MNLEGKNDDTDEIEERGRCCILYGVFLGVSFGYQWPQKKELEIAM